MKWIATSHDQSTKGATVSSRSMATAGSIASHARAQITLPSQGGQQRCRELWSVSTQKLLFRKTTTSSRPNWLNGLLHYVALAAVRETPQLVTGTLQAIQFCGCCAKNMVCHWLTWVPRRHWKVTVSDYLVVIGVRHAWWFWVPWWWVRTPSLQPCRTRSRVGQDICSVGTKTSVGSSVQTQLKSCARWRPGRRTLWFCRLHGRGGIQVSKLPVSSTRSLSATDE